MGCVHLFELRGGGGFDGCCHLSKHLTKTPPWGHSSLERLAEVKAGHCGECVCVHEGGRVAKGECVCVRERDRVTKGAPRAGRGQ